MINLLSKLIPNSLVGPPNGLTIETISLLCTHRKLHGSHSRAYVRKLGIPQNVEELNRLSCDAGNTERHSSHLHKEQLQIRKWKYCKCKQRKKDSIEADPTGSPDRAYSIDDGLKITPALISIYNNWNWAMFANEKHTMKTNPQAALKTTTVKTTGEGRGVYANYISVLSQAARHARGVVFRNEYSQVSLS